MKLINAAIILILFTGCSKSDDDDADAIKGETPSGTFTSDCEEEDGEYSNTSFVFSDDNVSLKLNNSESDSTCAQADFTAELAGTFTIDAAEKEPTDSFYPFSVTFSKMYLTVIGEQMTAGWNAQSVCGKDDWKAGTKVDVTDLTCEQFTFSNFGFTKDKAQQMNYKLTDTVFTIEDDEEGNTDFTKE